MINIEKSIYKDFDEIKHSTFRTNYIRFLKNRLQFSSMLSQNELRDLLISVLVLSFAFYNAFKIDFLTALAVITLVFVLHEMSHRYLARRYGCFAEYKMWTWGVILALLSSFAGVIFAAPGAVYISPYCKGKFAFRVARLSKKDYGKISLAGPLTNLLVGAVSTILLLVYPVRTLSEISQITFSLAFFNLLPFFPLDGSKVFDWDRRVWLVAIAASVIGLISLALV
jgi:Zn-dependent protease